jgi:ABC-type sugar transport system ATPase subunit
MTRSISHQKIGTAVTTLRAALEKDPGFLRSILLWPFPVELGSCAAIMAPIPRLASLLRLQEIRKSFYGTPVLKAVNFELQAGEVHALLGENGAGKSTLIKILAGAYTADSGSIWFRDEVVRGNYGPKVAEDLGIVTIYQNFHLIPHLSVAENLALKSFVSEPGWFVDWRTVQRKAEEALARLHFPIQPSVRVKDLSVAQQQMLEIAIALSKKAQVIVMDEPTAALSKRETEILFHLIGELKERGLGIVYVSHKLEEIKVIGDRITILRDGNNVATLDAKRAELNEIIRLMIGAGETRESPRRTLVGDKVLFSVDQLRNKHFSTPLDFAVYDREIFGITGLVGAGKTELTRVLFGADQKTAGEIRFAGKPLSLRRPRDAVQLGLGYVPEDRDNKGLCLNLAVAENLGLATLVKLKGWLFDRAAERKAVRHTVSSMRIRTQSADQQVKYLSGGNKQKVVLGKWLAAACKLLVLDEPTIGIDVGARQDIYTLIQEFRQDPGHAVILVSSDIDEVLEVADRVLVLADYRVVAELDPARTNKQEILEYCARRAATSTP